MHHRFTSLARVCVPLFGLTCVPSVNALGPPGGLDRSDGLVVPNVAVVQLDRVAREWASSASATTALNVSVRAGGASELVVPPGGIVPYEVVGLLSDDRNEGLALVGFDLIFNGGPLPHADIPTDEPTPGCDNPMINFTRPWGITNPDSPCPPACGFGGTIINGALVQVGGGQNTIRNTPGNAPFPIGPVLLGVAQPGGCGPAVLVTGSFTAPSVPGVYTLMLRNMFGNIIKEGETGEPFWVTQAALVGRVDDLVVVVQDSAFPGLVRRSEPTGAAPSQLGAFPRIEPSACPGAPGCPIPTVSQWGLVVAALLLLTGARIAFRRTAGHCE